MTGGPIGALEELHPDWLYVFLVGPGSGEGIAVRLPGQGWLLVDGCRRKNTVFLSEILKRWRAPLLDFVLTHPHADHVGGVSEVIEEFPPEAVYLAGTGPHLLHRCYAPTQDDTNEVADAMRAIMAWEAQARTVTGIAQGSSWVRGQTRIRVCSPEPGLLTTHLALQPRQHANRISTVLSVEYGKTRLLLGGDLPVTHQGYEVSSGWNQVLGWDSTLSQHTFAKIAHHGSQESLHARLHAGPSQGRTWAITPFGSHGLPREGGVRMLLEGEPELFLTAVPASCERQVPWPPPARIPRADFFARLPDIREASPFLLGATRLTSGFPMDPMDPLWGFAFDSQGQPQGCWRGRAALVITR